MTQNIVMERRKTKRERHNHRQTCWSAWFITCIVSLNVVKMLQSGVFVITCQVFGPRSTQIIKVLQLLFCWYRLLFFFYYMLILVGRLFLVLEVMIARIYLPICYRRLIYSRNRLSPLSSLPLSYPNVSYFNSWFQAMSASAPRRAAVRASGAGVTPSVTADPSEGDSLTGVPGSGGGGDTSVSYCTDLQLYQTLTMQQVYWCWCRTDGCIFYNIIIEVISSFHPLGLTRPV